MATTPGAAVAEETAELWITSFQGEVLGEAYFAHMAKSAVDPDQQAKLRALAALERCTKEALVPVLRRHGLSTEADPAMLAAIATTGDVDYLEMVRELPAVAGKYLHTYSRLRRLVEPEDVAVADLLIAHELALELFARRETAGETDASLDPIRALAHVTL